MHVIATSVCPMFIPWCFLPVCNYTDSAAAGRGGGSVVSVASCVLDNDGRCNRDKVTVENAVNHCCAGRVAICTATPVTRKTRPMLSDSSLAINEDASPPEMRSVAVLPAACLFPCNVGDNMINSRCPGRLSLVVTWFSAKRSPTHISLC